MDAGATEDTEVEDMIMAVVMEMAAKEDVWEGSMIITYTWNKFASRYGTFVSEARVYPADQWQLLSLQQNNNTQ